jgi:hypothetical protein
VEIPDREKRQMSGPALLDNNVDMARPKVQICYFMADEREPFCANKIFIQQIRHKTAQMGSFHASAMA